MHDRSRLHTRQLTSTMHATLETAAKHGTVGLRRIHKPDMRPAWPAHPSTLTALVNRELLHYERAKHRSGWPLERWTVTDLGRQALEPAEVTRRDVPVYLARSGGQIRYRLLPSGRWTVDNTGGGSGDYTTDASKSIDHDRHPGHSSTVAIEVLVGPEQLSVFAAKAHERERDRLRQEGDRLDRLTIEYRTDQCAQEAARKRVDVTTDLRKIRHLHAIGRTPPAQTLLVALEERLTLRAA